MKKLLSILSALIVCSAVSTPLVSCGQETDFNLDKIYNHKYNYQTGPSKIEGYNTLSNDFITSINVSSKSTYATYYVKSDVYHPYFYGNKENFLKTRDDNFSLSGWRNDDIQFQNIVHFKKNVKAYKDIKVSLKDVTEGIDDSARAVGTINFEKYLLTPKFSKIKDEAKEEVNNIRQYVSDAVLGNQMSDLAEEVKDNTVKNSKKQKVFFDTWNLWGSIKTPENESSIGKHKLQILFEFTYDGGKSQTVKKDLDLEIKKYVLNKNTIYDENGDNKVDRYDKFGFSAGTFPARSQYFWDDDKYKNIDNYEVYKKIGTQNWSTTLDDKFKKAVIKNKKPLFIDNGSDIEAEINDGVMSFTTNSVLPFNALYELYDENDKLIGTVSIYYNKDGVKPNDRNKSNLDLNGDGENDELGPNPNYADYFYRTPKEELRLQESTEPLVDSNGWFLRATGMQQPLIKNNDLQKDNARTELIQYIGNLDDSSYKFEKHGKYADDYEYNLAEKDPKNFFRSTENHKWNWSFDFHNLDTYMRLAAKNNIDEVLINPIDISGFSFFYLKGSKKEGPLRSTSAQMINPDTGRITSFGRVALDNIFEPMTKALSDHLNKIKDDGAYKTSNGDVVNIYYQFDEDREDLVDKVMETVESTDTSGMIHGSAYLGWRSDIENSWNWWKYFERDLNNPLIDQEIFTYKRVYNEITNDDLDKLKDLIQKRSRAGKTTMFYTIFSEYPILFVQSDLSGAFWQSFFNYRIGTNGYTRWAYDFIYDNYLRDYSITLPDPNMQTPAGEQYVMYGGTDKNGPTYSTRMLALIESVNYVYKLKTILHSTQFNDNDKNIASQALKEIGIGNRFKFSNNDYKYNVIVDKPDKYKVPTKNYDLTVSEQVYALVKTIDSL